MVRQTLNRRLHALTEAQDYKCAYCNAPFLRAWQITFDHVIPKSRGGVNALTNGLAACQPCNLRKGGRNPTPEELAILARISQIAMGLLAEWGHDLPPYRFDLSIPVDPPPTEVAGKPKRHSNGPVDMSSFVSQFDKCMDRDRQRRVEALDKTWPVPKKKERMRLQKERRARNMQRVQESKAWPYNSLPVGD